MRVPVTEAEHGRLYLSGLCLHAAEFLLRGVLSEQWSIAREMVVNDLADSLVDTSSGKPARHVRRTNVPLEEWRAWVDASAKEAAEHATYRDALRALDNAVTESFYPFVAAEVTP